MTTISIKIPDDLAARLDEVARAENVSRSALFRRALADKLNAKSRHRKPSLYELSADLCGIGDSGMGDLASNPKHMEKFGS